MFVLLTTPEPTKEAQLVWRHHDLSSIQRWLPQQGWHLLLSEAESTAYVPHQSQTPVGCCYLFAWICLGQVGKTRALIFTSFLPPSFSLQVSFGIASRYKKRQLTFNLWRITVWEWTQNHTLRTWCEVSISAVIGKNIKITEINILEVWTYHIYFLMY